MVGSAPSSAYLASNSALLHSPCWRIMSLQGTDTWKRHVKPKTFLRISLAVLCVVVLHNVWSLSGGTHPQLARHLGTIWGTNSPSPQRFAATSLQQIAHSLLPGPLDADSDVIVNRIDYLLAHPPRPPYDFLIGTMERNEGPDIIEWIFYHMLIGFEHFVVYDHMSDDDTRERLLPLVELGWVTLVLQEDSSRWAQPRSVDTFMSEWKLRSKWLFFLDIDEYVARNQTQVAAAGGIGHEESPFTAWFESEYGNVGGVAIPRLCFTSNGHYRRPQKGVMQAYTEARAVDRNFFVPKLILQARYRLDGDIHKATFSDKRELVDPLHKKGNEKLKLEGDYPFYIHHYWAKSWDECVKRIKQKAFPGSWREEMGDRFCRYEMRGTEQYAELEHEDYNALAIYGRGVMHAVLAFEHKYARIPPSAFTLSVLAQGMSSTSRTELPQLYVDAGTTFVVDAAGADAGYLSVRLSNSTTKRQLPVTRLDDGGVAFTLPAVAGGVEITITREYSSLPSPVADPVSPCSIMGHIENQPDRTQLKRLAQGPCRGVNPSDAFHLAKTTWRHPQLQNDVLFTRFVRVKEELPASMPSQPLSLAALGQGSWRKRTFNEISETLGKHRLYSFERCPHAFDSNYWGPSCGNETRLSRKGVWRWTPDDASSYQTISLWNDQLESCLRAKSSRPRRILLVGDSVMSHTFMASICMLEQARVTVDKHVRFSSLQYEMFDMVDQIMSEQDWEELLRWNRGANDDEWPDVAVVNVGLWAATWASLDNYAAGLESALQHLGRIEQRLGIRIVWRETTASFPGRDLTADPLYQVNPRIEAINEIANRLVAAAGIPRVDAYRMSSARVDSARDNAHMCPCVQGDLAEVMMYALCNHVLS
ncbi:BQ5605_C015g07903 [Microbotryum silenes-dioicae]|uniref:BQ5605_C015g07903 protein n=1 Tax=Microbotryum silenes-dioicae TaxID=796604 RepID=A0A2X0LTK3_9BASI|nr:BQ5605_C015g07903 [Microbotryum silenes-dioicae]